VSLSILGCLPEKARIEQKVGFLCHIGVLTRNLDNYQHEEKNHGKIQKVSHFKSNCAGEESSILYQLGIQVLLFLQKRSRVSSDANRY
jgi:hypothetical protein